MKIYDHPFRFLAKRSHIGFIVNSSNKDNNNNMDIQLIDGLYTGAEALDLLTQMIHVKITFHEKKIRGQCAEEEVKSREQHIKQLQKDLFELRHYVAVKSEAVVVRSSVVIT